MGHVLKTEPTGPADMLTMDTEGKGRTGSDSASGMPPAVAFTEIDRVEMGCGQE